MMTRKKAYRLKQSVRGRKNRKRKPGQRNHKRKGSTSKLAKIAKKLEEGLVYEQSPKPYPKYLVKSSAQDTQRLSMDKLERCPHGVPRGKICAICEPDKFRDMVGFD
jgi:hypothetical protein